MGGGLTRIINSCLYKVYCFLHRSILFKNEIDRIQHYYEIISPSDYYDVGIGTVKLFLKSMIVSCIIIISAFIMMSPNLYSYGMVLVLVSLIKHQVIIDGIEREEYRLLKQLEIFMGEVRHHYTFQGMVEEALDASLEEADYEISIHIKLICEMLQSGEDCDFINYKELAPHKLFITFLALCQTTMVYGDTVKDGKSLFLKNLASIKREINTEILKRDKIRHTFSGLLFITILPAFFLEKIEHWGISNLPSLSSYYKGGYGITVTILIFLLTFFAYRLVILLRATTTIRPSQYRLLERLAQVRFIKKMISTWYNDNPIKGNKINELLKKVGNGMTLPQYLVQVGLIYIASFLVLQIIICNVIIQSRWNVMNDGSGLYATSFIENKDKIERYDLVMKDSASKYKTYPITNRWWEKIIYKSDGMKELEQVIKEEVMDSNPDIHIGTIDALVDEIVYRVVDYQQYYYRWYYLLFSCLISIALGHMPKIMLHVKNILRNSAMEDEVLSFYSIITMLMYIPRMHVSILLDWLEIFSQVFQESLTECIDNYTYDEEVAFNQLKEKEPYLPFVRLIQNLEACDKVGVERAFDELSGQREFYIEKRKQDNEIQISNKGVIGKVVAYMPFISTIGLYLIIPFVLESIRMFMNYVTQINTY